MNKYDLTKLEDLVDGESSKEVTLSPETVYLCLMALNDRVRYRGAWLDDDAPISGNRWDVAENLVNKAIGELMAE